MRACVFAIIVVFYFQINFSCFKLFVRIRTSRVSVRYAENVQIHILLC